MFQLSSNVYVAVNSNVTALGLPIILHISPHFKKYDSE